MRFLTGIDAVVVNYRTPADLERFCASFPTDASAGLVIVNVCPGPDDLAVARRWQGRLGASLVSFADNVGYARAVNRAATLGRREVLAIFNADIVLTPGALHACHRALMDQPGWGVLGPRQVDDRGRFTHAGIFGTGDAPKHRGWHEADRGQYRDVVPAVTVSGAAYFIRRDTWDELTRCPTYRNHIDAEGAFLPTVFYFEETFCSYHAAAHGWEVVYFGEATVTHTWHAAVRATASEDWAARQWVESRAMFRAACDAHGIARD